MSRPEDEYPNDERKYPNVESFPEPGISDDFHAERGLSDLNEGRWTAAEQRFTSALTQAAGRRSAQALAVIGVAQARLFGRRDARGAFALLQTLFGREPQLRPTERARLHVVAAFLFADEEPSVHDRVSAARHAVLARQTLGEVHDLELAALCAAAESLLFAFDADRHGFLELSEERHRELQRASSPVTRCLALEVDAMRALAAGQRDREAELLGRALEDARALGFAAAEARLLLRAARRTLDACRPEERRSVPSVPPLPPVSEPPRFASDLDSQVRRLAPSRVTVLLVGASAALIDSVARALHERSGRAEHPFVTFDCRELGAGAIELRLFGGPDHLGSTGGAVREAGSGTLHVAAIEQLPRLIQPRFLRFLDDDKRVRVVASTSVDLRERVEQGQFRQDLGERLTLVQLLLPEDGRSV
jgi:transcriptional regulator of acetoin/glycerol metabolism